MSDYLDSVRDLELIAKIKELFAQGKDYSEPFRELVTTKPLSSYIGKKLAELAIDVESYLHDPEITKDYNWKEILEEYTLYLPFYSSRSTNYLYIRNAATNFSFKTVKFLCEKLGAPIAKFIENALTDDNKEISDWMGLIILSKSAEEKYSEAFKELVSIKPLTSYVGDKLAKLGIDTESYLHDPEITKNYDWKGILQDQYLYLPFSFSEPTSSLHIRDFTTNFTFKTIKFLCEKSGTSTANFIDNALYHYDKKIRDWMELIILNKPAEEKYSEAFKELVSTKPLTSYIGDKLAKLGIDTESYLHDPEITKNYDWKEILQDYNLHLPFHVFSSGYISHTTSHNFTYQTIELLRVKSGMSVLDFLGKTSYSNDTTIEEWKKFALSNKSEEEGFLKEFRDLISKKPLDRNTGSALAKLGIDTESYLHDPEITKNYNWKEILQDYSLYLPFAISENSFTYGYDCNFSSKTIELLYVKSEMSISQFMSWMTRIDTPGVNEWTLLKLADPEILKAIILKQESNVFIMLSKHPYEQISGILNSIEQNEELLSSIRSKKSILEYVNEKFELSSAQPLTVEKLNKIIFAGQNSDQILDESVRLTLLDGMLIATSENMTDIMSDEQIRNIQFSKVNTKFFNFGNYKLLAYLKSHSEGFSDEQILNKLQTDGASQTKIQLVKKLLKFVDEFNEGKLSELELKLINNNSEITVEEVSHGKLNNSVGFDAMFLALSTSNYTLARALIENGSKFYEDNEFGLNKISLITLPSMQEQDQFLYFIKFAHEKENFPLKQQITNTNDYPLDLIINNYDDPDSYFIELTNSTLYKFKNPENVSLDQINKDKVSIAISHGYEFWSIGIFSATHYLQKQNPDVDFYMVNPSVIEQLGVVIFSAFDGWINPGAGDSYPTDKAEFSRADWKPSIGTEHIYQNVLGNATIYNLPTFGMCAGAQNLVLHHGGYIKPIEGYSFGTHDITLTPGSSLAYLALNPEEREQFHQTGHMPVIKFKGDTAHHFVAVNGKLPAEFSLGAVSEHNEAMGYCDATGIHCATQFHPEHHAGNLHAQTEIANYQIQLLNGFIELARMNHNCKNDVGICPTEFMANAKVDLDLYHGTCPLLGHDEAVANEVCTL